MARKVMTRKFKFFNYEFNLFEVVNGNPVAKGVKTICSREDLTKDKIIDYYGENFLITNLKKEEIIKSFQMDIDEFINHANEVIDKKQKMKRH